ncbi:sodium:potassium antiporter [Solibacillus sp. FSL H8-0538]|uniref:sodium:potassium antiporter n=1 Tax=Solibacillus sp. FSL H8-0538 TaxID=2921400 RepID=UPI0030F64751
MTQNFTYLMFLCAASMLLIVGGVLLTNLPIIMQIIMISIGLLCGIVCFITLIRLLIHTNQDDTKKM